MQRNRNLMVYSFFFPTQFSKKKERKEDERNMVSKQVFLEKKNEKRFSKIRFSFKSTKYSIQFFL